MTTTTKTGTITYIAKTDGIHLDGDEKIWYNPIPGLKIDSDLKNRMVTLTLTEKPFTFSDISATGEQEHKGGSAPTDRKEILIARQVAIKAAVEIAPSTDKVIGLAKEYEDWILRQ